MFLGRPSIYGKPCGPKWIQMCFCQIIWLQENKVMLQPCFFHSCKWPHWAQVTIRSQSIFQHFIKRENTSGRVMEEIYGLPHLLRCQWLASFCVATSPFHLARQGNFFEIRLLSLQWVTQSHSTLSFPTYAIDFKFNFKVHESLPCPPSVVLSLFLNRPRQLLWDPSLYFSMHLT